MSPAALLSVYLLLILASSLLGGALPSLVHLTHLRMQVALSLVGGLMLGIGLLHLLPHGVAESGSLDGTMLWVLAGLLATFFLIRVFHFHEHSPAEVSDPPDDAGGATEHDHADHHHDHPPRPVNRVRWLAVCLGLAVHTLVDGVTLGAAMAVEAAHGEQRLWGAGVFVAIVLHKPLDALSVTTLMQAAGWSLLPRQIANFLVALMCPLGALVAWEIGRQPAHSPLLGAALGFAAGAFVCISLSDLLPELQFHRHDGVILSVALLGGIALALVIGWLEPAHLHERPDPGHPEHRPGESRTDALGAAGAAAPFPGGPMRVGPAPWRGGRRGRTGRVLEGFALFPSDPRSTLPRFMPFLETIRLANPPP